MSVLNNIPYDYDLMNKFEELIEAAYYEADLDENSIREIFEDAMEVLQENDD